MGTRERDDALREAMEEAQRADGETTPEQRRRVALDTDDGVEQGSHDPDRPINMNLIYNNPEKWAIGKEILERYTGKIGRASCRERVESAGGALAVSYGDTRRMT